MTTKSAAATDASPESTTLTSAYASGWVSDWIDALLPGGRADYVRLLLTLGTGDATSIQMKLEVEDGTGTDGFTTLRIAGGTTSIDEVSLTPAGASATERYALQVHVPECRRFRVRAKKTGGSGTVTLALEYLVSVGS